MARALDAGPAMFITPRIAIIALSAARDYLGEVHSPRWHDG
jgi:hypothetical protein